MQIILFISAFTFWPHDLRSVRQRERNRNLSEVKQHDAWNEQYKEKLKVQIEIPSIFIDPVLPVFDAQASDEIKEEEWRAFARETNKLWTLAKEKEKDPFVCNSKCNSPSDFFNGIPTIQGIDKGLY